MKIFYSPALLLFICNSLLAQVPNQSFRGARLDTNRIVYDEQGKPLRYYQYSERTNSGEYTITPQGDPSSPDSKQFLRKLPMEELKQMMEMTKKYMSIKSNVLQENMKLDVLPLKSNPYDNKINILIFWYADCPPCTESFTNLNGFFRQLNPDDVNVIAITPDDESKASEKLKEKPLLFARLISNGRSVINTYQVTSYPSYVITDRNRIIKLAVAGQGPQTIPLIYNTLKELSKP